jgi:low affinity Fe/Cu permease
MEKETFDTNPEKDIPKTLEEKIAAMEKLKEEEIAIEEKLSAIKARINNLLKEAEEQERKTKLQAEQHN